MRSEGELVLFISSVVFLQLVYQQAVSRSNEVVEAGEESARQVKERGAYVTVL